MVGLTVKAVTNYKDTNIKTYVIADIQCIQMKKYSLVIVRVVVKHIMIILKLVLW